jgi:hypothetical protein
MSVERSSQSCLNVSASYPNVNLKKASNSP